MQKPSNNRKHASSIVRGTIVVFILIVALLGAHPSSPTGVATNKPSATAEKDCEAWYHKNIDGVCTQLINY